MVKAHRHLVTYRIARYKLKQLPRIIARNINIYLPYSKEMLAFWLSFLDLIEKATLEILDKYKITNELVKKFLNYARKQVREGKITNFLSILIEYYIVLETTFKRNPILKDYQDILKEIEHEVNKKIGQYIHLWCGFYDLAYYDISTYF